MDGASGKGLCRRSHLWYKLYLFIFQVVTMATARIHRRIWSQHDHSLHRQGIEVLDLKASITGEGESCEMALNQGKHTSSSSQLSLAPHEGICMHVTAVGMLGPWPCSTSLLSSPFLSFLAFWQLMLGPLCLLEQSRLSWVMGFLMCPHPWSPIKPGKDASAPSWPASSLVLWYHQESPSGLNSGSRNLREWDAAADLAVLRQMGEFRHRQSKGIVLLFSLPLLNRFSVIWRETRRRMGEA